MRPRLLLSLFMSILFFAPASAFSTSSNCLPCLLTDTTEASGKNITELPKSKKVGFFKKIGNAVVGFIVKMHIAKANKKSSTLVIGLASLALLIAGLALAFSSNGAGHTVSASGLLAFVFLLLGLTFAIVFVVRKIREKKAKKE